MLIEILIMNLRDKKTLERKLDCVFIKNNPDEKDFNNKSWFLKQKHNSKT